MANPTAIISRNPRMNGLRRPTRSDAYAVITDKTAAVMYIGIVISCALLDV
jgi:hypothetical protein